MMKKFYKYWTFILPIVLYIGTIWQRPLFFPAEIDAAEALRRGAELGATGTAVLGTWSVKLLGANLFAVRLPNALAVLLTAVLIMICTNCCSQNKEIGKNATIIYLTTLLVFITGTAAGVGAFLPLFYLGIVSGLMLVFSATKRSTRLSGGAIAGVSIVLTSWYLAASGPVHSFTLPQTLLILLVGLLPNLFLVPAAVKGFQLKGADYFKQSYFLIPAIAVTLWLIAIILYFDRLPAGALYAGLPMLAILTSGGLIPYQEEGNFVYVNTLLRILVRLLLGVVILIFVLQTIARFTDWVPSQFVIYRKNETFLTPVLTLIMMIVWLKMAQREYRPKMKFCFFYVGIAFLLLAIPSSLPRRILRKVAPEPFLKLVLESRLNPDSVIVARPQLHAALSWVLKRNDVRLWPAETTWEDLKINSTRTLIIATGDRKDFAKLPRQGICFFSGQWYVSIYDSVEEQHP